MPSQTPSAAPRAATLPVRVTPRARYDHLEGWQRDRLLVRTTAPPLGGRANDAVCRLLAEALGIAPSRVRVVRGAQAREKIVEIRALGSHEILRRLGHPGFA